MINRHDTLLIAGGTLLALLSSSAISKAEPFLYVTQAVGNLVKVDVGAGTVTVIGNFNAPGVFAMAISPQGELYTATQGFPAGGAHPQLARVDLNTGQATPFGVNLKPENFMGLGFSPAGVLYGVNAQSTTPDEGSLYQFDPATGAATKIGVSGGCGMIMDLAWHPDGTMYGADPTSLYRIDPNTGLATLVTTMPGRTRIMGLAIDDDGNFYVTEINPGTPLLRLDPSTGATTPVPGVILNFPHGLEFIPTPRSRPVSVGFWKSVSAGPCDMAGRVDMDLNGSDDGNLCYLQVPGSSRVSGRSTHFSGDYMVETPFYFFTARMNVVLNENNGTIRGDGIVTKGWLEGTQVHLDAQAEANGAAGVIRLMPASAD